MENITVENANEMLAKAKISDTTYRTQAAAWVIVNQFCYQAGLYNNREDDHLSGIQKVIKYLSETQSENKALQEKLKIADHLKELADDAIITLQKEVEELKGWKKSAIEVIGEWEKVFNLIDNHDPKNYGRSKAKIVFEEIERLKAQIDRLYKSHRVI